MNRERKQSTILSYFESRRIIEDGDVLLYRGSGLRSWIIRKVTRSEFSHAGIAAWWNDRLMVLEAVGRGVIVSPLSVNIAEYHGQVFWYQSRQYISRRKRKQMIAFAQQELGKKYAHIKTLWLGIRILFNKQKERRDRLRREQKLFCSLYVAQIYNAVGLDLKRNMSDAFMTPEDIARSPLLICKGILKA